MPQRRTDRVVEALANNLREKISTNRLKIYEVCSEPLLVPGCTVGRFRIQVQQDGMLTVWVGVRDLLNEKTFWEIESDDTERAVACYASIISDPAAWYKKRYGGAPC